MSKNFEDVTAFGKEAFENGLKAYAALSKGSQAIVVETSEYAKRAMEDGAANWQSLLSAKSFDKALEI